MNIKARLTRLEDEARSRQPKPPVDYAWYVRTADAMQRLGPERREVLFRFCKSLAAGEEPDAGDVATVDALPIDWDDLNAGPQDV